MADETQNVDAAANAEPAPEAPTERLDEPDVAPSPLEASDEGEVKPAKATGKAVDPSNTYEHGVQPRLTHPGVNYGVPEGATVTKNLEEATEAGYLGYAPGVAVHEAMTAKAAGERNERLRNARINGATTDAETDEATGKKRGSRSRK